MANNFPNINKTKESLKSDGQQFHQYEHPPLTSNHWTQNRKWCVQLEIQVLAWDKHKYVAGLNRFIGS